MYQLGSSPMLTNVTIAGNRGTNDGGGMTIHGSSPELRNSIIYENTAPEGNQLSIAGSGTTTMRYSCFASGTDDISVTGGAIETSDENSNLNPKFVNSWIGDYRISRNSPCINAGLNIYTDENIDIRGKERIQNTTVDMGAYEWSGEADDPVDPVLYVDESKNGGNNDGTSWTNAYTSLQTAITAAPRYSTLWIAKGTYLPSSDHGWGDDSDPRLFHFEMKADVSIYGGFSGTETSIHERTMTDTTFLSGDIGITDDTTDNCYHVLSVMDGSWVTHADTLNGVTITGGNADGTGMNSIGGGVFLYQNSPTLVNVTITRNTAAGFGGGMYNSQSSPRLTNVTVSNNGAYYGGGICNGTSSPTMTNVTISGNIAVNGGGLYNSQSSPLITNGTIAGNKCKEEGGGMLNSSSSPTLKNSIVWGNDASSGKQFRLAGGGVTTLSYSCYAEGADNIYVTGASFTANDHCITESPKLVKQTRGDLRILGISPCIDAGNNDDNTLSGDIRGKERIQNGTIDMGAYEWTSGTDALVNGITYVDASRSDGGNNGSSWVDAYTSLQSALDASDVNPIWVARGIYRPSSDHGSGDGSDARLYHFEMKRDVPLYGGFAGTETALDERSNYGPGGINATILSGDVGIPGSNVDNCYNVLSIFGEQGITNNDTLNGVEISGGNANGTEVVYSSGGGIFLHLNSPSLVNVTIRNNSAMLFGGGMYTSRASPKLTNVLICNNTAYIGGGITSGASELQLTNVTVAGNIATSGGGISDNASMITLNNSIVWGNYAEEGSQIILNGGGTTALWSSCYSNSVNDISADGSTFTVDENTITVDPQFADAIGNDYRLKAISSCIDAGNDVFNGEHNDIRGAGYPRKTNKDNGASGRIDIGAFEYSIGVDPLPVTLVSFTAEFRNNGVSLEWKTASEQNSYGFEIERKCNEEQWKKIASVACTGKGNVPTEYSYFDRNASSGISVYRLKQLDSDGAFTYSQNIEMKIHVPTASTLEQNYPNPFNPSTTIRFTLQVSGHVTLKVYDVLGREVATLVNENLESGIIHERTFDISHLSHNNGERLSSGIFFSRLVSSGRYLIRKMVLLK